MATKRALIALAGAGQKDWQAEADYRTLCEAKAIEKDPARKKKVQEFAKNKLMECASIAEGDD